MAPLQRTNSPKMKQAPASHMKSKAHGNKTVLTFLTDNSQHIRAHYVSFSITLPYYLGYFSQ